MENKLNSKSNKGSNNPSYKHGDRMITSKHHYLYNIWRGIKTRCFNSNANFYELYGGDNITIYEPWIKEYPLFKTYILENLGERPDGMTLDRINVHKAYEPNNLRWATQRNQCGNKKIHTDKLLGVQRRSDLKKVRSGIRLGKKLIHLGYFDDPYDAHLKYLRAKELIENGETDIEKIKGC